MRNNILFQFMNLFLFFLLVFPVFKVQGQSPDSLWMFNYGGSDNEIGFDAIEGADGIYYVIGKSRSSGNGGYDAYMIKLDNNGGVIWEKTYGGQQDEQVVSVCPALYGGFVMTGYTATNSQGLSDIWILAVSEDGDSLWSKQYGGLSSDQGYCIRPDYDQGYIMTARMSVYTMGDQLCLMKLTATGDTIWTKTYGGPNQDYGQAVAQATDGGYIIAGRTYSSYTPESGDAWALKTDNSGDTLWTRKYGGNDEDMFYAVAETGDGYVFAGQTRSFGNGVIDVYVVRTDYDGDTLWTRAFGGPGADYAYSIAKADDDNFIITGYSDSFTGSNDVYMLKIDGSGNLLWEDHYGDATDGEIMYGCSTTSDGGFIVTGKKDYYTLLQDDLFALKLGTGGSGLGDANDETRLVFYNAPNPFRSLTTFHFSLPGKTWCSLEVYNTRGELVRILLCGQFLQGESEMTWDAAGTAPGVYFCKLNAEGKIYTRKMVVIR
jgi:hypothetical protein